MLLIQPWHLSLLAYFICGTAFSVLQRRAAQNHSLPIFLVPALIFCLIVYPIGVLYALVTRGFWLHWDLTAFLLMAGMGIALGAFNAYALRLNRHVDAMQYIIVSNLYTPLTVVLGIVLLHERFTGMQSVGLILLICGALLVSVKGLTRDTFRLDKHTVGIAMFSVLMGLGLTMERAALDRMSVSIWLLTGYGIETLVILLWSWRELSQVRKLTRRQWGQIIPLGFARAGHLIFWLLTLALSGNLAVVATVTSFRIPLVFLASYLILRERDHVWRKMAGVAVATVGLLLT